MCCFQWKDEWSLISFHLWFVAGSARASGTNRFPRTKGSSCKSKLKHRACSSMNPSSLYCVFMGLGMFQGPAGKDGLPGHPGQRGETVSELVWLLSSLCVAQNQLLLTILFFLLPVMNRDSKARLALLVLQVWSDLRWVSVTVHHVYMYHPWQFHLNFLYRFGCTASSANTNLFSCGGNCIEICTIKLAIAHSLHFVYPTKTTSILIPTFHELWLNCSLYTCIFASGSSSIMHKRLTDFPSQSPC